MYLLLPLTKGYLSCGHNFLANRVALLERHYCTPFQIRWQLLQPDIAISFRLIYCQQNLLPELSNKPRSLGKNIPTDACPSLPQMLNTQYSLCLLISCNAVITFRHCGQILRVKQWKPDRHVCDTLGQILSYCSWCFLLDICLKIL